MSIKKFAIADGNKTTDESSLPTGGVTAANQGEDDALAPQVASHACCHDTKSGDEEKATRQSDSPSPTQEEIGDRRRFNGKAGASGWIEKYYKTRDAAGLSQTVSGGQEHSGCSGPYFHYQWKEGVRTRTRYVPRKKVEAIEQAIARRAPYVEVLALL